MEINDLDYLMVDLSPTVGGALYTDGYAFTYTERNFAYASASSVAYGESTFTNTRVSMKVRPTSPYSQTSSAQAQAEALATNSYGYSRTVHESSSWSLNASVIR